MKNVMGLIFFPPRVFLIITFEWVSKEIKRHQNLSCYEHCCWENKSILPNVNMQLVIIMCIECVSLIRYSSCNIKMRAVAHWSLICALCRCTLSLGLTGALPASSRGLCAQEAMKGPPEVKLGRLHNCRYGYYTSCSELDPYSAPPWPPTCLFQHSLLFCSVSNSSPLVHYSGNIYNWKAQSTTHPVKGPWLL